MDRTASLSSAEARPPREKTPELHLAARRLARTREHSRARSRRRALEHPREHFVDMANEVDLDLLKDLRGHLLEVPLVLRWEHDFQNAGAMRGEHLVLHAVDWKHHAAQRNLPRGRDDRTCRNA